jgi:hypothetical protein
MKTPAGGKKPGLSDIAAHEFGSQATDLKLSMVEAYLRQFSIALRRTFPKLWYIDAFAGSGERTVRVAARGGDLFDEPGRKASKGGGGRPASPLISILHLIGSRSLRSAAVQSPHSRLFAISIPVVTLTS